MISVLLKPQELEPTYNPIIIVATSSRQNLDNYLMVGDLLVNGATVSELRIQQNPDGVFLFDLHKHIERDINYDFNPNSFGWSLATASAATYSISLGDEWRPTWTFEDNFFLPGSKLGFIGTQSQPPDGFATGSFIIVTQTTPFTFSQYNGLTKIVSIIATQSPIPGYTGSHWIIETSKNFLGNTPKNGGTITLAGFEKAVEKSITTVGTQSLWAFNGVRTYLDDISWNSEDYTAGTNSVGLTSSFLTEAPDDWIIGSDSRMWLLTFNPSSTEYSKRLIVETNRGVFGLTNSFTSPSPSNKQPHLHIGCGTWHLSQTASFHIISGSFPIFDSGTETYKVLVEGQSGATILAEKRFKIDHSCTKYENLDLIFLDALGSFIPYRFKLKKRENISMNRTHWGQHYGRYPGLGQNWTYNTWDRGKTNLDTQVTEVWTLTTDWLSTTNSAFMAKLLQSPEVYTVSNGVTLAVNILDTEIERKKTLNDQIINYTLRVELSQKNSTQRG